MQMFFNSIIKFKKSCLLNLLENLNKLYRYYVITFIQGVYLPNAVQGNILLPRKDPTKPLNSDESVCFYVDKYLQYFVKGIDTTGRMSTDMGRMTNQADFGLDIEELNMSKSLLHQIKEEDEHF